MNLKMTRVDGWVDEIEDQPGSLAHTLQKLTDYGTVLDLVLARRVPDEPGSGVVYVFTEHSKQLKENAKAVGLSPATETSMLKIEGVDVPGGASKLAQVIAEAGVNLASFSAAVVGHRFVCYAGFDSELEREIAERALKPKDQHRAWRFWNRREVSDAA